jgi:hypothetical protein
MNICSVCFRWPNYLAAGLIAHRWGPPVGGLFLAFPTIFPAIVSWSKNTKRRRKGPALQGVIRGREAPRSMRPEPLSPASGWPDSHSLSGKLLVPYAHGSSWTAGLAFRNVLENHEGTLRAFPLI